MVRCELLGFYFQLVFFFCTRQSGTGVFIFQIFKRQPRARGVRAFDESQNRFVNVALPPMHFSRPTHIETGRYAGDLTCTDDEYDIVDFYAKWRQRGRGRGRGRATKSYDGIKKYIFRLDRENENKQKTKHTSFQRTSRPKQTLSTFPTPSPSVRSFANVNDSFVAEQSIFETIPLTRHGFLVENNPKMFTDRPSLVHGFLTDIDALIRLREVWTLRGFDDRSTSIPDPDISVPATFGRNNRTDGLFTIHVAGYRGGLRRAKAPGPQVEGEPQCVVSFSVCIYIYISVKVPR